MTKIASGRCPPNAKNEKLSCYHLAMMEEDSTGNVTVTVKEIAAAKEYLKCEVDGEEAKECAYETDLTTEQIQKLGFVRPKSCNQQVYFVRQTPACPMSIVHYGRCPNIWILSGEEEEGRGERREQQRRQK